MKSSGMQSGFTLLEVLVALAIVAIALAACMRAVGVGARGTNALKQRSLALQSAENRLAELRLLRAFPVAGRRTTPCSQGPLELLCDEEFKNTVNGNFRQVTIRTRLAKGPVLAELNGLLSPLP